MSFTPLYIAGSDFGKVNAVKPYLAPDKAYTVLENAYVLRERVIKREGLEFFGRLKRLLVAVNGNPDYGTINGTNTYNLISGLSLEATSQIAPGSILHPFIILVTATGQTLTDDTGTGVFTIAPAGTITAASINYATGIVTITATAVSGPAPITITTGYYPGLPVMGIRVQEIAGKNNERTVFFDTKYAYINSSGVDDDFQEFTPGFIWDGDDTNFFWATNYRGSTEDVRLFFVTNNKNSATIPMRYHNGATWNAFTPQLNQAGSLLLQALILIPYYGRLVALNTTEGNALGGGVNYFNRARFSQIGNPIEPYNFAATPKTGAWAEDIFGKGGFIDAPTNEEIVSAYFFKNTLIAGFERSTWQLRYVGEYGLPFLWERISSDFGCESTNSGIVFDEGVAQIGDRAITLSTAVSVNRIDEQIPDEVFSFRNTASGKTRVQGIRDFQKEIVYWCYVDTDLEPSTETWKFPNKTLVYNYRNQTYANFRNNVTAFGTYQSPVGITWDRTDIKWDDEKVFWDNVTSNAEFPDIVSGNQQGYIHKYATTTIDEPSLYIKSIDLTLTPVRVVSPDHNLDYNEWIRITDTLFSPTDPGINDTIFIAMPLDKDTLTLYTWDSSSQQPLAYSNESLSTYQGLGQITLYPRLKIQTKDFNPFQSQGLQTKISNIDFLFDIIDSGVLTINLIVNSAVSVYGNLLFEKLVSEDAGNFYLGSSQYAWQTFFATTYGQFIRVEITYNNDLMNELTTHESGFEMNAMILYVRPGGRTTLL